MESSPDDAAVKDMLREWAGEDVEMVLDEMRKLRLIEGGRSLTGCTRYQNRMENLLDLMSVRS